MLRAFAAAKIIIKKLVTPRRAGAFLTFVDVDAVYQSTLFRSQSIRPWAFRGGKYVALELRRDFAKAYLESSMAGRYDYKNTGYYRFIGDYTRDGFSGVYDGNRRYAIVDADGVCRRFMALIDSIRGNIDVYNKLTTKNILESLAALYDDIIAFERNNKREIFYLKEKRRVFQGENEIYHSMADEQLKSTMQKRLVGHLVPSGLIYRGDVIIKNGSHRLAAFKVLKDAGIFTNKFPVYVES